MIAVKIESVKYGVFYILISYDILLDVFVRELSKYDFCKFHEFYHLVNQSSLDWFNNDIKPFYKVYDSLYDFVKINIVQPEHPELFKDEEK